MIRRPKVANIWIPVGAAQWVSRYHHSCLRSNRKQDNCFKDLAVEEKERKLEEKVREEERVFLPCVLDGRARVLSF